MSIGNCADKSVNGINLLVFWLNMSPIVLIPPSSFDIILLPIFRCLLKWNLWESISTRSNFLMGHKEHFNWIIVSMNLWFTGWLPRIFCSRSFTHACKTVFQLFWLFLKICFNLSKCWAFTRVSISGSFIPPSPSSF